MSASHKEEETMQIREMTAGRKIAWRLEGSVLYFGEADEQSVDLADRQRDEAVVVDVYVDRACCIVGAGENAAYAANVLIPPRRYAEVEQVVDGETVLVREAVAVDVNAVVLQLWGLPEHHINPEGGM
jgi:hypothetical protein